MGYHAEKRIAKPSAEWHLSGKEPCVCIHEGKGSKGTMERVAYL